MSSRTERGNGAKRLAVEGDMTIYAAQALKEKLLGALEGAARLEVDLSRVGEVDTAGVQLLLLLKREATQARKSLRLTGHGPAILDAIDLFNLGAAFGDPVLIPARAAARAGSKSGNGGKK